MNYKAYYKLMRCHKPIGTLLLWFPTAWALWIANHGHPPFRMTLLFLTGTILMRSAGCVMNDIADRKIDLWVHRTKDRPLVSGKIGLIEAIMLLILLLFASALILLQLPPVCFYYGLVGLILTIAYPFFKRFIQCPQLILGMAFSLSIPMVFSASNIPPNMIMFLLLIINNLWIIAYDTQYAMADKTDDLRIGVKSTAILFANYDRIIIALLQLCFHSLWLPIAIKLNFSQWFFITWILAIPILIYQQWQLSIGGEINYLRAFSSNGWYGLILWSGIIVYAA